jgi:hypothetical protein
VRSSSLKGWGRVKRGFRGSAAVVGVWTWLDDLRIHDALKSERMGHEVPGMRGIYSHVTPGMRGELRAGLQRLWEESLHERVQFSERSTVTVLDEILAARPLGGSVHGRSRRLVVGAHDRMSLSWRHRGIVGLCRQKSCAIRLLPPNGVPA